MREYVVIIDDDVIFKKCQGLDTELKQQDKERYGGSDEGKTWRKNMLLLLMLFSKMPRPWYGSNKTRSDVRGNGRKTWCEEIASAGIDLPSTNRLSCKTFFLEVGGC